MPIDVDPLLESRGQGWIRTSEGVSQQIYSLSRFPRETTCDCPIPAQNCGLMGRQKNKSPQKGRSPINREWPVVYPIKNKSGTASWCVDLGRIPDPLTGKLRRVRNSYPSEARARHEAEQVRKRQMNHGQQSLIELTPSQEEEARRAFARLQSHDVTLSQCIDFYLRNGLPLRTNSKPLEAILAEALEYKKQDGAATRYLKDFRLKVTRFVNAFSPRPMHEISSAEIDDWLRSLELAPTTRKGYRQCLGVFFSHARKRGYIVKNPIPDVETATIPPKRPGILTPAELKALLSAASPQIVPAICLGAFAGCRPESEIIPMRWSAIDLKTRQITIDKSKNVGSHRFIHIEDNLLAWLKRYAPEHQGQEFVGLKDDAYLAHLAIARERAAEQLGARGIDASNLLRWPQDALRHSYGSYHSVYGQNDAATAQSMGHSGGLRLFQRFYRHRVTPKAAKAYWSIFPPKAA